MEKRIFKGVGAVLRVGELFLKGGNRHLFMDALVGNVQRALAGRDDVKVTSATGRIFVKGAFDEDIKDRLRWVFGISSFSPVVFCDKDMEAIAFHAVRLATEYQGGSDTTFRIAARRSDKTFMRTSAQIGIEVGSAVAVATGYRVDLERPDLRIGIEIGKDWCILYTVQHSGGGGLPVGSSGRVALLLSGGIDSPVAGHLLQKRGLEVTGVYFHAFPYTGDGAREKVIALARVLARRQKQFRLHVVPFARVQEAFRDGVDPTYLVLLYRRAMVRIAESIARASGIKAIATGESLGQVASQTLENIATVEDAAGLPVLRPLITMDKVETIQLSREIGTYDISIQPHDDCCTLFVPKHPQTKGSVKQVRRFEGAVEWEKLVTEAAENAEQIIL